MKTEIKKVGHTPGPWKVWNYGVYSKKEWDEKDTCTPKLAQIHHNYDANVRLIAAAPELLEAVKFLLQTSNTTKKQDAEIRALIARAESIGGGEGAFRRHAILPQEHPPRG